MMHSLVIIRDKEGAHVGAAKLKKKMDFGIQVLPGNEIESRYFKKTNTPTTLPKYLS